MYTWNLKAESLDISIVNMHVCMLSDDVGHHLIRSADVVVYVAVVRFNW